jgi:glutamyl-tRNA reductase
MTAPEPWVHALDAASTPAAERARVAESWSDEAARPDRILLQTCHRVELYGVGPAPAAALPAAEHLLRVAAGLESAVIGEDEVLHQVRSALQAAAGPRDVRLTRLFESAIAAGRRARAGRTTSSASLAGLALRWLAGRTELEGRPVVVAGAGHMGWALARAARHAGAEVTVASRSRGRAEAAARSLGARAADLAGAAGQTSGAAAVAVALAGPWEELRCRLPPTADLSWPSAVPPHVRGEYLGVDDLFAGGGEPPPGYVESATAIVAAKLAEYRSWLEVKSCA